MRLPRGYDNLAQVTPIAKLGEVADGTVVLVRGTIRRLHVFPRRLLDVIVDDDGASVRARWFRPHASMAKAFVKGSPVALAGPLRTAADGTREMVHPSNVTAELAAAETGGLGLRPRYADVEGVKRRTLASIRTSALAALAPGTAELLPAATRARLGLRRWPSRSAGCTPRGRPAMSPTRRWRRHAGASRSRRCSSRRSPSCSGGRRRARRRCW